MYINGKKVVVYFDMDGVLNRFEDDKDARKNMWNKGYFSTIRPMEDVALYLSKLNKIAEVDILSKCIDRVGVMEEKDEWGDLHLNSFEEKTHDKVIYVPHSESKLDYIEDLDGCFNILVDDNIHNLDECAVGGVYCIYFGEKNDKYPNITNTKEFPNIIQEVIKCYLK